MRFFINNIKSIKLRKKRMKNAEIIMLKWNLTEENKWLLENKMTLKEELPRLKTLKINKMLFIIVNKMCMQR